MDQCQCHRPVNDISVVPVRRTISGHNLTRAANEPCCGASCPVGNVVRAEYKTVRRPSPRFLRKCAAESDASCAPITDLNPQIE